MGAHPILSSTVLSHCEALPDINPNLFLSDSPACWVAFSEVTLIGNCFLDHGAIRKSQQIFFVTD